MAKWILRKVFKYMTVGEVALIMDIFLSCQRELSTIRTYVLASVGTFVFGLAVVFVMIYFFSGKNTKACIGKLWKKAEAVHNWCQPWNKKPTYHNRCKYRGHRDDGGREWMDKQRPENRWHAWPRSRKSLYFCREWMRKQQSLRCWIFNIRRNNWYSRTVQEDKGSQ